MTKPVRPVSVLGDALLRQLQIEAEHHRHQDDDCLPAPDPLASAQSRRAAEVLL